MRNCLIYVLFILAATWGCLSPVPSTASTTELPTSSELAPMGQWKIDFKDVEDGHWVVEICSMGARFENAFLMQVHAGVPVLYLKMAPYTQNNVSCLSFLFHESVVTDLFLEVHVDDTAYQINLDTNFQAYRPDPPDNTTPP